MKIGLSPVRHDTPLEMSVNGETVTFNGEAFDFSGAPLAVEDVGCPWLLSDVVRIGGELEFTIILPHGERAPQETLFPQPITVTADGPVELPPYAVVMSDAEKDVMLLDMLVHVPGGLPDPITGEYK